MPPSPPEGQAPEKRSPVRGLLLLVFLLGVPLLAVSGLFVTGWFAGVVDGAQPGGVVRGRVVDPEGRPIKAALVTLQLAAVGADGAPFVKDEAPGPGQLTRADGSFEFTAPPHEGHYRVRAGGDLWVSSSESFTMLGGDDPEQLELTLTPGCLLRLKIVAKSGLPARRGDYVLHCLSDAGSGHLGPAFRRTFHGSFREGLLERGGLVPGEVELALTLEDGTKVEFTLTLAPGVVNQSITL